MHPQYHNLLLRNDIVSVLSANANSETVRKWLKDLWVRLPNRDPIWPQCQRKDLESFLANHNGSPLEQIIQVSRPRNTNKELWILRNDLEAFVRSLLSVSALRTKLFHSCFEERFAELLDKSSAADNRTKFTSALVVPKIEQTFVSMPSKQVLARPNEEFNRIDSDDAAAATDRARVVELEREVAKLRGIIRVHCPWALLDSESIDSAHMLYERSRKKTWPEWYTLRTYAKGEDKWRTLETQRLEIEKDDDDWNWHSSPSFVDERCKCYWYMQFHLYRLRRTNTEPSDNLRTTSLMYDSFRDVYESIPGNPLPKKK